MPWLGACILTGNRNPLEDFEEGNDYGLIFVFEKMALATIGRKRNVFERGEGKGCLYGGWCRAVWAGQCGGDAEVGSVRVCVCVCMVMVKQEALALQGRVSQGNSPGVEILLYLQNGSSNEHLSNY